MKNGWSYGDSNSGPLACHQQATRPPQYVAAGHRRAAATPAPPSPGRLRYFRAVPFSLRPSRSADTPSWRCPARRNELPAVNLAAVPGVEHKDHELALVDGVEHPVVASLMRSTPWAPVIIFAAAGRGSAARASTASPILRRTGLSRARNAFRARGRHSIRYVTVVTARPRP
jgi:hypothetical protein